MNAAEGARSFYKDREEREGTETDRTWSFHKKATRERGAGARPQPRSGSEGSTPRNKRNNVTTRINIGENALLKRNMNRNVTFRKRNKPQEAIVSDLEFFRSPRAKNNHGVAGLDAGHLGSLVPCRDHIRQQDCVIHVHPIGNDHWTDIDVRNPNILGLTAVITAEGPEFYNEGTKDTNSYKSGPG